MAQPKPPRHPNDKIEIEPGADIPLANILKKALNTPLLRKPGEKEARTNRPKGRGG